MTTAARAVLTALLIAAAAAVMPSRPRHRPPVWAVELAHLDAELRGLTGRGQFCLCSGCTR